MDASLLAVALAAAQTMALQSRLASVPERPTLIDAVDPRSGQPALGAKAVGLLVESAVGGVCKIDQNQTVNERAAASCIGGYGEYLFDVDGRTQFIPYFKSSGEGENFIKDWTMPNGFKSDAAMFSGKTLNPWGLSRVAHLAELEVNGGLGSPANELHFITTGARVLDRTAAYPLDAESLIQSFLQPFADANSAESKAADKKLQAAVQALQAVQPDYGNDTKDMQRSAATYGGFAASWLASAQTLRVVYYRRLEDSFSRAIILHGRGRGGPPRRDMKVHLYGAEYAVQADYSKAGALLSRLERPVSSYTSRRNH